MLIVVAADTLAQQPRACLHRQQDPGGLSDQEPNVLYRPLVLRHAHNDYTFATFSDTAERGRTREQCFRYEVENTGQGLIRQFYWPLAGLVTDPLRPGQQNRVSKTTSRPILDAPIDVSNEVFAFEFERAETRAWTDRRQKGGSLRSPKVVQVAQQATGVRERTTAPEISVRSADAVLVGLKELLERNKLPSQPFLAVQLGGATAEAPMLTDHYSTEGLELYVKSSVVRDKDVIQIKTTISARGAALDQISIPALFAQDKMRTPLSDLKLYSAFITLFRDLKDATLRGAKEWSFSFSYPANEIGNGTVYRMDHPVFVVGIGRRDCVLVASYSPSPISFGLDECRSWLRWRPADNSTQRSKAASNN